MENDVSYSSRASLVALGLQFTLSMGCETV